MEDLYIMSFFNKNSLKKIANLMMKKKLKLNVEPFTLKQFQMM